MPCDSPTSAHRASICPLIYLFTSARRSRPSVVIRYVLHVLSEPSVRQPRKRWLKSKSIHDSHVAYSFAYYGSSVCGMNRVRCFSHFGGIDCDGCECISRWREQSSVCMSEHKCKRYQQQQPNRGNHTSCSDLSLSRAHRILYWTQAFPFSCLTFSVAACEWCARFVMWLPLICWI